MLVDDQIKKIQHGNISRVPCYPSMSCHRNKTDFFYLLVYTVQRSVSFPHSFIACNVILRCDRVCKIYLEFIHLSSDASDWLMAFCLFVTNGTTPYIFYSIFRQAVSLSSTLVSRTCASSRSRRRPRRCTAPPLRRSSPATSTTRSPPKSSPSSTSVRTAPTNLKPLKYKTS